ncbi:SMI1/KNR4 family protein [Streptomyces sp. C10-9-1]|uniref:SMI1/KNR4 family protein n=1 Tax=Streptomyces sp. C10-9-1 TaxID=1859285 RepID=UPI003D719F64
MKIDWRAEYLCLVGGRRSGFFDPDIMRRDGFPLERRLTETDLREAEGEFGITFPSEYREHLLRRGNPERGFNRLWRGPRGWGWYGDTHTNYDLLTQPFPHPDSYRAADDDLDEREPPREDTERGTTSAGCWRKGRRPARCTSRRAAAASPLSSLSRALTAARCGSTAVPPATRSSP